MTDDALGNNVLSLSGADAGSFTLVSGIGGKELWFNGGANFEAKAAYDDEFFYLIWKVEDQFVLARRTEHQQPVYRDSCVEFFFTPGGDPAEVGYFNLETNCAGVKLFGIHVAGSKVEKLAAQGGATREAVRKETAKPKLGRPKSFVFAFRPPTKAFNLRLSFSKSKVEKDEIIEALQNIIAELRARS